MIIAFYNYRVIFIRVFNCRFNIVKIIQSPDLKHYQLSINNGVLTLTFGILE